MLNESYLAAMWLAHCYVANSPATLENDRETAKLQVAKCEETTGPESSRSSEDNVLAAEMLENETVQRDVEHGGTGFCGSLSKALARFPLM